MYLFPPILRGRDIKRYKAEFADLYLINTHNGIKSKNIARIDVVKDYPAIYEHLQQFEKQLIQRQDKGDHWTNLRSCIYTEDFNTNKIIWAEMTNVNAFVWDNDNIMSNQTCYFIPNASKYLLAVLNSKITCFYFSKIATGLGEGAFRWIKQFIELICIPQIKQEAQLPFIVLVEEILAKKAKNEDVFELENQINKLVYALYELTEAEIKIIEKTTKNIK